MDINTYLHTLIADSATYAPNEEDIRRYREDPNAYLCSKLFSKKFRKWKLDDACVARTKKAVALKIERNEPLSVIFFQGGYKLWRLPSSPEADWAEVFNVAYLFNYIAPIAAVYEPGVKLSYYFHTLLMEKHDNLTTEEVGRYVESFETILDTFRAFLPDNVNVGIVRDADLYDRDAYFAELETHRRTVAETIGTWPQDKYERYTRMARLNIKWKGAEDWTTLTDAEKEEKVKMAAIYEEAAGRLVRPQEAVKSDGHVLVFTKPSPTMIGIGSTYNSMAKYWVGTGVLEYEEGQWHPRILTPSQYEAAQALPHETKSVDIGLPGKNFRTVEVYPQRFRFQK